MGWRLGRLDKLLAWVNQRALAMQFGQLFGSKVTLIQYAQGQRVAQGQGDRGAGGGRQAERAGFFANLRA